MPRTAKVRTCVVCGVQYLTRSPSGWIRLTCSDACAREAIARGHRGRVATPAVRARLAEAARANQANRIAAQKAARLDHPWAMPPHDAKWRAAHMARMARGNPMDDPATLAKMTATVKQQFRDGRPVIGPRRPDKPYVLAPRASIQPRRQPKLDTPARLAMSVRMKADNPMRRPDVAARMGVSLKRAYQEGRINPPSRAVSSAQELELFDCFAKAGLPLVHCGGRQFWIGPCQSGKRRNPDMRHVSARRAILFSSRYWHTPEDMTIQLQDYLGKGWAVLNFWDDTLRTTANKNSATALAAEFLATGSVSNPLPSWAEVASIPSL